MLSSGAYVISKAQVELLQDEEVAAELRSGHGHVTDGLTHQRHGRAAAVQLRQAEPHVQGLTCKTNTRAAKHDTVQRPSSSLNTHPRKTQQLLI